MDDLKDVEVDESKSVSTSAVCYEDKRVSTGTKMSELLPTQLEVH